MDFKDWEHSLTSSSWLWCVKPTVKLGYASKIESACDQFSVELCQVSTNNSAKRRARVMWLQYTVSTGFTGISMWRAVFETNETRRIRVYDIWVNCPFRHCWRLWTWGLRFSWRSGSNVRCEHAALFAVRSRAIRVKWRYCYCATCAFFCGLSKETGVMNRTWCLPFCSFEALTWRHLWSNVMHTFCWLCNWCCSCCDEEEQPHSAVKRSSITWPSFAASFTELAHIKSLTLKVYCWAH